MLQHDLLTLLIKKEKKTKHFLWNRSWCSFCPLLMFLLRELSCKTLVFVGRHLSVHTTENVYTINNISDGHMHMRVAFASLHPCFQ